CSLTEVLPKMARPVIEGEAMAAEAKPNLIAVEQIDVDRAEQPADVIYVETSLEGEEPGLEPLAKPTHRGVAFAVLGASVGLLAILAIAQLAGLLSPTVGRVLNPA